MTCTCKCMPRAGVELPSVDVRFEGLEVSTRASAPGRELPSIFNSYRNFVEVHSITIVGRCCFFS